MSARSPQELALKRRAYRLAVQKNRAAVYTLAGLMALASRAAGTISADYTAILLVIGGAYLSAVVFAALCYLELNSRADRVLDFCWMVVDAFLISWGVVITGGYSSPWFPWYLANVAGAAFVVNTAMAIVVVMVDILSYCGALALCGHISGFNSSIFLPLTRLLFLFGASFFFLRGISLLRRKRAEIRRMRDEARIQVEELTRLTAALDQRTQKLAEANLQISEADRAKSQFLANMSHELRTPLNSIIGFSEVLTTRLEDSIGPRYFKFLGNINESGRHLLGIINDVLDLSKIEAGKIELNVEELSARELIDGVCGIMKSQAQTRGISFDIDCSEDLPFFAGDPVRVKQVLYNLLSNAVKFSHEQGVVEINARMLGALESPLERPALAVSIADHGIGIDPSKHGRIFEEFEQADGTTTRQYGGTGLGLALVKRFMQLHGGMVVVESSLGLGSTFSVFFPQGLDELAAAGARQEPVVKLETSAGRRILIVEDDPTAFERLARGLSERSWLPVRARNAHEAIHLVKVIRPSVILLDIVLPGLDGWEVLRRLKASAESRDIPVIIVSLLDNRELGMTLGAVDYFVKPVPIEELAQRLIELLPFFPEEKANLLLIDDDPHLHELMEAQLEEAPIHLCHALSGEEGLVQAREIKPDLIILDLMMEGMDGFTVAARLRENPETENLPIVVYTQKEMTARDLELLKGKTEALISKGRDGFERLQEAVDRILGWKQRRPHS